MNALLPPTATLNRSVNCVERDVSSAGRNILVIDDDEFLVELVSVVLSERGFQVRSARHAQGALDLLRTWVPEVVLLGSRLPIMTGRSFVKSFRNLPGQHAVIIALATDEESSNADDVIPMPFDIDDLVQRVSRIPVQ
jgi:DNA-binding response OmpR family regulator